MISVQSDSIFTGNFEDAIAMAEELVGYFYTAAPQLADESDEIYLDRCAADRQAIMVEMMSNAGFSFDIAMVRKTVDVITDGTFASASMFKLNGASTWRQMVLDWIRETFNGVSPSLKSRVADVITILLPALRDNGVAFNVNSIIGLIIDRGGLHMPWKVRLACETIQDAIKNETINHDLCQSVYDRLLSPDDSRTPGDVAVEEVPAKAPGVFQITATGYRIVVDVNDEVVARLIERKLNSLVEWEWETGANDNGPAEPQGI